MKTKQVLTEKYCIGCRHFLYFECDIFRGSPSDEQKVVCNRAGYRAIKQSASSVRIYSNRQGAPNNGDVR